MIPRLLASGALLLGMLSLPARAAQDTVVLYPPDLTLTSEGTVKVFAFRQEKGAPDNVSVNGVPAPPLGGETYLKGEAKLFPGLNVLRVGGRTVRLFFLADAKMEQFRIPGGKEGEESVFNKYRLHPALDDGCEGCHTVGAGKPAGRDQREACYACHDNFEKAGKGRKVSVHVPVASGECTGCHDPHFAARPGLQKLDKGCYECHDAFPSTGTIHRPVQRGECTACHSPHAGAAPKQLLRPGNSLCLGCHEAPHARHRSPEVRGAMTKVPETFPLDNGSLACTGCHAPHQSQARRLFKVPEGDLCTMCHLL